MYCIKTYANNYFNQRNCFVNALEENRMMSQLESSTQIFPILYD
uniref:Uncharacterized protein n=1 Tax=Rhizophora mucronata TaxID=61149 RepID=A0A2P2QRJ9_RHIMU